MNEIYVAPNMMELVELLQSIELTPEEGEIDSKFYVYDCKGNKVIL